MTKEVIGIIGPICAGKDTTGDYLASKLSVPSFQISAFLKELCAKEGVEPTRENLIELGTALAAKYGDAYLVEYLLEHIPDRAIITGMRQLGQIALLESESNLTLISVDADQSTRFVRATLDGKLGEAKTLEEFVSRERAENSAPNAQRLFEAMELARYNFTNDGTVEDLYTQLDEFFSENGVVTTSAAK